LAELNFTHVGITVSNLDVSIKFYEEVFGFKCRNTTKFDEKFFGAAPNLYRLQNTTANVAFMVSPNGITLEMFQFIPDLPKSGITPWNVPAYTHIALSVDDLPEFAKHLRSKNVEFCMDVLDRFDGGHWVFVRDPDGNMVEIGEPMRKH
jgi:catechol 2,3-dioxygenase-like lactoylglutathione lyase family enzyme